MHYITHSRGPSRRTRLHSGIGLASSSDFVVSSIRPGMSAARHSKLLSLILETFAPTFRRSADLLRTVSGRRWLLSSIGEAPRVDAIGRVHRQRSNCVCASRSVMWTEGNPGPKRFTHFGACSSLSHYMSTDWNYESPNVSFLQFDSLYGDSMEHVRA